VEKINKIFIGKVRSVNEEDFTLEAVASDETIDRYKEVIKADAYKKRLGTYKKHPILLSSHKYNALTNQIGMAEKVFVKDGELITKFKYFVGDGNPEADWAWKLASKYGMAAFSVGFLPWAADSVDWNDEKAIEAVKAGKKPYRTFTDVELLEISQVLVPANPSAMMKSFEELNVDKDSKAILKTYAETISKSLEDDVEDNKDFMNVMEGKEFTINIIKDIDNEELQLQVEENMKKVKEELQKKEEDEKYMKETLEKVLSLMEDLKKDFETLKTDIELVDKKVGDIFEKGIEPKKEGEEPDVTNTEEKEQEDYILKALEGLGESFKKTVVGSV